MSEYTPQNIWHGKIRQFEVNEIVEGGIDGIDNIPHHELADCIFYLFERLKLSELAIGLLSKAEVTTPVPGNPPGGGGLPDVGVTPPEPVTPPPASQNPSGTWTVTQVTPPLIASGHGVTQNYTYIARHSSGQQITGVSIAWGQFPTTDKSAIATQNLEVRNTDASGVLSFTVNPGYFPVYRQQAVVNISAQNSTNYKREFVLHQPAASSTGHNSQYLPDGSSPFE